MFKESKRCSVPKLLELAREASRDAGAAVMRQYQQTKGCNPMLLAFRDTYCREEFQLIQLKEYESEFL